MYNPATNLFESFDVTFAGVSFNLAPAANTPAATLSGFSCFGDRGDAEGFFQSLTGSCGVGTWQYELNSGTHSFRIQFVAAGDILSATATRISVAPGAPAGGPPGSSPTQSSGPPERSHASEHGGAGACPRASGGAGVGGAGDEAAAAGWLGLRQELWRARRLTRPPNPSSVVPNLG